MTTPSTKSLASAKKSVPSLPIVYRCIYWSTLLMGIMLLIVCLDCVSCAGVIFSCICFKLWYYGPWIRESGLLWNRLLDLVGTFWRSNKWRHAFMAAVYNQWILPASHHTWFAPSLFQRPTPNHTIIKGGFYGEKVGISSIIAWTQPVNMIMEFTTMQSTWWGSNVGYLE